MWYMYADHGTGVCLGFDAKKLIQTHQSKYKYFLEPFHAACFYGHEGTETIPQFKRAIATFIKNISNLLKEHYSNGGTLEEVNEAEYLDLTCYYIIVATLAFKHGAFAHECERRFFALVPRDNTSNVRFDEKKRPYILMNYDALAKDLLKEIWLAHPKEADVAKTFFSHNSGKPIEVLKSRIPFPKI